MQTSENYYLFPKGLVVIGKNSPISLSCFYMSCWVCQECKAWSLFNQAISQGCIWEVLKIKVMSSLGQKVGLLTACYKIGRFLKISVSFLQCNTLHMHVSIWVLLVVPLGPGGKGNQIKHAEAHDAHDVYCTMSNQVHGLWYKRLGFSTSIHETVIG